MLMRLSSSFSEAENDSMKALFLLLLALSSTCFAQGYRMTGNFTLFGNTINPIRSTFTLMWTETNGAIEGTYSDNVLAANAGVTGRVINGTRSFVVSLGIADPRYDIKSLSIETSDVQGMNANLSATIVPKDSNGSAIQATTVFASIIPDNSAVIQAQQAGNCTTGFGALTNYCGLYAGNLAESEDARNICQLSAPRLELATNGDLSLYFNYSGTLRGIPRHYFGSLLGTPMDLNINAKVRVCSALPGTNMSPSGCKVLHLVGSFQDFGGMKNFSGTYDIRDEVTGSTCRYSMNFGRDTVY